MGMIIKVTTEHLYLLRNLQASNIYYEIRDFNLTVICLMKLFDRNQPRVMFSALLVEREWKMRKEVYVMDLLHVFLYMG